MLGAREKGTEGSRMTKTGWTTEACQEGVCVCKVSTEPLGLEHRLSLLLPCGVSCSCQQGHRAPSLHFITLVCLSVWAFKASRRSWRSPVDNVRGLGSR